MTGNGFVFFLFRIQAVGNVAVGGPVVAQPLNAVGFVPFIGNAVEFTLQGNIPMEGSFKNAHMLCVRQNRLHGFNGF